MRAYGMDVATTTEIDSGAKLFALYTHLANNEDGGTSNAEVVPAFDVSPPFCKW